MHVYSGPGKYVAVCNKTNFDGHYVKEFEVPAKAEGMGWVNDVVPQDLVASWWFLNKEDGSACLEAVYPKSIFDCLTAVPENTKVIEIGFDDHESSFRITEEEFKHLKSLDHQGVIDYLIEKQNRVECTNPDYWLNSDVDDVDSWADFLTEQW